MLAERAPDLADAIADARIASRNAGIAAQRVGVLADSTNNWSMSRASRRRRICARRSPRSSGRPRIWTRWSPMRPGVQNFSKNTLPEVNRLVRDLRDLSTSLQGFSQRLDENGVGGALGPPIARLQTGEETEPNVASRRAGRAGLSLSACMGGLLGGGGRLRHGC